MNKTTKTIIGVVAGAAVIGGGIYLYKRWKKEQEEDAMNAGDDRSGNMLSDADRMEMADQNTVRPGIGEGKIPTRPSIKEQLGK